MYRQLAGPSDENKLQWILDYLILLFYHENALVMSDILNVYVYVSRLVNQRRMLEVKFARYSRLYAVCIRSVKCSSS